ncbi:MAG TPA: GTP pyrophosphokinase [Verrucomicrobiae bacterium]|nr:GTP pyrophosphokinase [Verrucomicrobiae bacterium]
MTELDLLELAIGIAVEAHRGQKDRYGAPYILHPLRIMARVETTTEKTAAILHDVVEDTNWTFDQLKKKGFPQPLLEALECVTKREGEAYEDFVKRSASNPLATRVKLADLEDNMDIRRMPEITQKDQERLEKYLRAWRFLRGIAPQP